MRVWVQINWVAGVLIVGLLGACNASHSTAGDKPIRDCPDQWVIDRNPTGGDSTHGEVKGKEYFLYEGKRYNRTAFDSAWVAKNCKLSPTLVD